MKRRDIFKILPAILAAGVVNPAQTLGQAPKNKVKKNKKK